MSSPSLTYQRPCFHPYCGNIRITPTRQTLAGLQGRWIMNDQGRAQSEALYRLLPTVKSRQVVFVFPSSTWILYDACFLTLCGATAEGEGPIHCHGTGALMLILSPDPSARCPVQKDVHQTCSRQSALWSLVGRHGSKQKAWRIPSTTLYSALVLSLETRPPSNPWN